MDPPITQCVAISSNKNFARVVLSIAKVVKLLIGSSATGLSHTVHPEKLYGQGRTSDCPMLRQQENSVDILRYLCDSDDGEQEKDEDLVLQYCCNPRALLDFRLGDKMTNLIEVLRLTNRSRSLKFLCDACKDYDFAYEFGQHGGHFFLKNELKLQSSDDLTVIEDIISSIVSSGCIFPTTPYVDESEIHRPELVEFRCLDSEFVDVYTRLVPQKMHGKGQYAVGYVLWPAALILSRCCINS